MNPRGLKTLKFLHENIKMDGRNIEKGFNSYLEVMTLEMVPWIERNQLQKIEGKGVQNSQC